jgi:hypothetical protein
MTPVESALAVLVEEADWATLQERMAAQNFQGETVITELVEEHLEEVEKLTEKEEIVETVPEEVDLTDSPE